MPVCLHCGEIVPEGALFCTKCGFTLPQAEGSPLPPPPSSPRGGTSPVNGPGHSPPPPPPVYPLPLYVPAAIPTAYATLAAAVPGAAAPMPPPPNGKYCVRCRTIISRAAVYCPVCQQPQSP